MSESKGEEQDLGAVELTTAGVILAALRGEEDAQRFYESAAKQVERQDARQLLLKLADDEASHIKGLTKVFRQRFPSACTVAEIRSTPSDATADPRRVAEAELPRMRVLEILAVAMWEESKAIRTYGTALADVGDDHELGKLLKGLLEVERMHYQALDRLRQVIAGELP